MSIVAKHSTDKVSVICLLSRVDILVIWFLRAKQSCARLFLVFVISMFCSNLIKVKSKFLRCLRLRPKHHTRLLWLAYYLFARYLFLFDSIEDVET